MHPSRSRLVLLSVVLSALLGCKIAEKAKALVEEQTGGGSAPKTASSVASAPAAGSASAAASGSAPAPAAGGSTVPSPKSAKRPELAVGQWHTHRVTKNGKPTGEFSYRVVGKEGDAFWMEVENDTGGKTMVLQILLGVPDIHAPEKATIEKVKMKLPGGRVQELSGAMLKMTQGQYQKMVGSIIGQTELEGPQKTVSVEAGTFEDCYERETDVEVIGIRTQSTIWNHPAVPITTMVESISKDGTRFELVDYGMTGAKSTF